MSFNNDKLRRNSSHWIQINESRRSCAQVFLFRNLRHGRSFDSGSRVVNSLFRKYRLNQDHQMEGISEPLFHGKKPS
jgi:hypothetical protein